MRETPRLDLIARPAWHLLPCATMLLCLEHAKLMWRWDILDRLHRRARARGVPGVMGYGPNPCQRPGEAIEVGRLW